MCRVCYGFVTGRSSKIPRVYAACYGVTGPAPPGGGDPYLPPLPSPFPTLLPTPSFFLGWLLNCCFFAYSIRTNPLLNHSWRSTRRKWKAPMNDDHHLPQIKNQKSKIKNPTIPHHPPPFRTIPNQEKFFSLRYSPPSPKFF